MHPRRTLPLALFSALLAAAAVLGACSKDKGTNPITTTNTETFNANMNATGASFQHTFTTASTGYCYHCTIHSTSCGTGMSATVVVDAAAAQDSAVVNVGGGSNVFNPASVTIKPGGYVRWVNAGGSHTVTRP
jgi:plastocyanin